MSIKNPLTSVDSSTSAFYRAGYTPATKEATAINAITFEIRDGDDNTVKDWTFDSSITRYATDDLLPPEFSGTSITLPLYPTDIVRSQPSRVEVTPSLSFDSNYMPQGHVDVWGLGLPRWELRGNTGWGTRKLRVSSKQTIEMDGYMSYLALYTFFESYHRENIYRMQQNPPQPLVQLLFYNWADAYQDYWYVEPLSLPSKIRSADRPLLYSYELTLIGVKEYASTDNVNDELAKAISDNDARVQKVYGALSDLAVTLNGWAESIDSAVQSVQAPLLSFTQEVQSISDNIALGLGAVKNVLVSVTNAVTTADGLILQLKNAAVSNPLSQAFSVINQIRQVKCGLQVLASLPVDLAGEFSSDVSNLQKALLTNGCGTTLRGTANIGLNSLR